MTTTTQKILLLLSSFALLSRAEDTLTPRQLFYSKKPAEAPKPPAGAPKKAPARKAAPAPKAVAQKDAEPVKLEGGAQVMYATTAPALALRWSIIQVEGPDSQYEVMARTFTTGDQVRIRVQPNQKGYLYVFARNSSGTWKALLPGSGGTSNALNEGEDFVFPGGSKAIEFKGAKGEERLFVMFARQPIADVEGAMKGLGGTAEPGAKKVEVLYALNDTRVENMRQMYSRDLEVEEVKPQGKPKPMRVSTGAPPADEAATYVASKSNAADGRLVAEIKLTHQ